MQIPPIPRPTACRPGWNVTSKWRWSAVADKTALHLERFQELFGQTYGHQRISTYLKRDVLAWQTALRAQGLAPATINNHLGEFARTKAVFRWRSGQGNRRMALPPLEPHALTHRQIATLKNLCDRLEQFCRRKRRR